MSDEAAFLRAIQSRPNDDMLRLVFADWVARIAEAAGWGGTIVTARRGRLPVPFNTDQDLVTDSSRIRIELGYTDIVAPEEALRQTVAWERAHLPHQPLDYAAEDAVITEMGL
jgi:hypothetical protein